MDEYFASPFRAITNQMKSKYKKKDYSPATYRGTVKGASTTAKNYNFPKPAGFGTLSNFGLTSGTSTLGSTTSAPTAPADKYAPIWYHGNQYDFDNPDQAESWARSARNYTNSQFDTGLKDTRKSYLEQLDTIGENLSNLEKDKGNWFNDYSRTMTDLGENLWNKNSQVQNYYSQLSPDAYQSSAGVQIGANRSAYNRGLEDASRQRSDYLNWYTGQTEDLGKSKSDLTDWWKNYNKTQSTSRQEAIDAINNALASRNVNFANQADTVSYNTGAPKFDGKVNYNPWKQGGMNVQGAFNAIGAPNMASQYAPQEGVTNVVTGNLKNAYTKYINGEQISASDIQILTEAGLI